MLEKAVRICEAHFGLLTLYETDAFPIVAMHNVPEALAAIRRGDPMVHTSPQHPLQRVAATRQLLQIADVKADVGYLEDAVQRRFADLSGARTLLVVPMLKEGDLVGTISIYRQEVRPFTDKQIALLQNFAAQVVIAIENARLLNELRQRTTDLTERTADLTEALEQQTATAEVLQIISSSSGDLKPVFEAMLASAMQICDAQLGNCWLYDGDCYTVQAMRGAPPSLVEDWSRGPLRWGPDTGLGRLATIKQAVHIANVTDEKVYIERDPLRVATAEILGARTFLAVPILKDHTLMGAIVIYRREVRPFTEKQIDLVKNFAAQAVIAIENARLLHELRETTDQVLKLNQQLEHRVADQVGEIERMSRLRRFLPPQVADLIVASGTEKELESHRREITALFCDLRGFTGFSESADPEDVITLLREYHEALGASIIKYSGTLERYAGDGVMVVFNDPVPVENPALQAVLMALEMRDAIGALTERWRRWGHEIGFGIGIAHGFATLGTIGFEGRFDYAAIGTVSNVASRLCDEAKPGQILISPRVLTKVENAVEVEPVGEFELKGIRRPLAAYNVVAAAT
jgi:class 3 adenylate cyclase/putative methionine-R-sulfoxide reductase with GAF domain